MKTILLALLPALCSGQYLSRGALQRVAGGGTLSISLVGQAHGTGTVVSSFATADCSGTACSSTTLNVSAHDLIYVSVSLAGGSCYTATNPTPSISDTGSTNTFTAMGTRLTNNFWGPACMWHWWADATAKSGDTFTVSFVNTDYSEGTINVLLFRPSISITSWAASAHDEKDGGNASSITSASLGNGTALDVLVGAVGMDNAHTGAWTAGNCGDSTTCTKAATTDHALSTDNTVIEYQITTGSNTAVTLAASNSATGGICMTSARFRPTP